MLEHAKKPTLLVYLFISLCKKIDKGRQCIFKGGNSMCKGGNLNQGRQLHNINYRASRTVLVYTHRWIVLNVIWMYLKTVFVTDYMIQQLEIQQASSSTCI